MATTFVQEGIREPLVNTTGATIPSGGVVVLSSPASATDPNLGRIGVAVDAIAANATGVMETAWVQRLPANLTANVAQGALVFWDAATNQVVAAQASAAPFLPVAGRAFGSASVAGATTIEVLLNKH